MHVKEAVEIAKKYVAELFGPEGAQDIALEEVEPDLDSGYWLVTVGFSRPWDRNSIFGSLNVRQPRTYKIVKIESLTGEVLSVKHREPKE